MSELRTTSIPNLLAEAMDTPAVRRAQAERERALSILTPEARAHLEAVEAGAILGRPATPREVDATRRRHG